MSCGSWPKSQSAEPIWNDDASRSPLELPAHHLRHCARARVRAYKARLTQAVKSGRGAGRTQGSKSLWGGHSRLQKFKAPKVKAPRGGAGGGGGALKAPKVYMCHSTTSKNFTHGRTAGRIVAFVTGFATTAIRRPLLVRKCKAQCAHAFTKCSLDTITSGSSGHQFCK